jgi:hypothetical protein
MGMVSSKEKKGNDFTKRFPPAESKDLPKEERELLERQKRMDENKPQAGEELGTTLTKEDQDLINRDYNPATTGSGGSRARKADIQIFDSLSGTKFFQERAADSLAYWAQFDHYDIEMKDGSYLKVYRVPAAKFALEELKNLNAEISSGLDFNTMKAMNPMEIRKKEIQFDEAKYNTYLRHQGNNLPVTRADIMDAKDSTVPDGIVESCLAISLSKWTEAKK